mgnify:FL=1|jgi:hypothetical protein
MINHHTKNKGDLGVLKAKCDLFQKGYLILSPETEHAPFDLVAWKDGQFKTVQVKYRDASNGKLEVGFRSCWTDKNGTHMVPVDKSFIDIYCIYCPQTDECYYLDPSDFGKSVTLRVETPKNNQKKGINLASDYREVP